MVIVVGLVLALAAVLLVLEPVLRAASGQAPDAPVPLFSDSDDEDDPVLARRDRALAALKEIDFDQATGKLSDEDYGRMKARFTSEALEALNAADAAQVPPVPQSPGPPVPQSSADDTVERLIHSARSAAPRGRFCIECGAPLERGRFCVECGTPVTAAV